MPATVGSYDRYIELSRTWISERPRLHRVDSGVIDCRCRYVDVTTWSSASVIAVAASNTSACVGLLLTVGLEAAGCAVRALTV